MKSSQVITMKEYALGNLMARIADENEEIRRFRTESLNGNLLIEPEEIPAWIKGQLERDLESFRTSRPADQPLDRESIHYKLVEKGINSEWCKHIEVSTAFLAFPDTKGKLVCKHPTVKGGVVERLRELSSDLARETGWPQANATAFILTGHHPRKQLIEAKVNPTTITLEIDVSVDAETVAHKYREIRKHYGLSHTRDAGDNGRKMRLAQFLFSKENQHRSEEELFKQWKKIECQNSDGQYANLKAFIRDMRRLRDKFSRPQQISVQTLLDENPYFQRIVEPTVTLKYFLKAGMSRATAYRLLKDVPKLERYNGSSRWPASEARKVVEKWKDSLGARVTPMHQGRALRRT